MDRVLHVAVQTETFSCKPPQKNNMHINHVKCVPVKAVLHGGPAQMFELPSQDHSRGKQRVLNGSLLLVTLTPQKQIKAAGVQRLQGCRGAAAAGVKGYRGAS